MKPQGPLVFIGVPEGLERETRAGRFWSVRCKSLDEQKNIQKVLEWLLPPRLLSILFVVPSPGLPQDREGTGVQK